MTTAAVALLLGSGCGLSATPPTAAPTAPSPTRPAAPGQGQLADDYAWTEDFSEVSDDWPDAEAFTGDGYVLAAGDNVPVPFDPPATPLGALAEVGVTMPEAGATTLTCDLGRTGTVALELAADGVWALTQTTGAGTTELAGGALAPGQRGEPGELTALRLLCSGSPDGLAVGVSLHGAGVTFVDGATGEVPDGGPTWTVSSTGRPDVVLDAVLVTLVET